MSFRVLDTDCFKVGNAEYMSNPPDDVVAAISTRLEALAALTDEPGRITRLYLEPAHRRAVELVSAWMREAGMTVRIDATGTVIGRYEAAMPGSPAILLGSHIDTVRDAGRFDGTLGVLTAIAVVDAFNRLGKRFPFAIEAIAFGDEEGVRFPSTLGGSRALAGRFEAAMLDETDAAGISRRQALSSFGCKPEFIPQDARKPGDSLGYLEIHIEQGPVLEAENLPIAVVTAINGASRGSITVTGESGHAGTVPMALRKDALAAAAQMILAIEDHARADTGLVATVGRIDVANSAPNTVPGAVRFSLDIRSPSDTQRTAALVSIEARIRAIAATRGVTAAVDMPYAAPAAVSDARLCELAAQSIARCGLPVREMTSGAGHDAMAFAGKIPFAMLFVRCRGGISHNPAEFAAPQDIAVAARVLADCIAHFPARF